MKSIFDKVSEDTSKLVIKKYSTSFFFSSSLLSKSIRQDIFNIYGFVRLADEIVDTFHEYPKKELLMDFETELRRSLENKISLNPILNSFQKTVNKYSIPKKLISSFLDSMKMDLEKKEYDTVEEYKKYIYGSADVVGLMCLKVFVGGSKKKYNDLSKYAISLGSAFIFLTLIWIILMKNQKEISFMRLNLILKMQLKELPNFQKILNLQCI